MSDQQPAMATSIFSSSGFAQGETSQKGRKGKLQALGKQTIGTLYMLIRNVRMYDAENEIFNQPLEQLRECINTVISFDGKFDLAAAGTVLTLNGSIITVEFSALENVRALTNEFKSRDMGGLQADQPVTQQDLKAFLRAFMAQDEESDALDGLVKLKASKYKKIMEQLSKQSEAEIDLHRKTDRKKYAFAVYARTITYMQRFISAVGAHKDELPNNTAAIRLVRDFVDICAEQRGADGKPAAPERNMFLGMTVARDSSEYLPYHLVNTCLTSIVVGGELGLSREQLFDLGRAALFHDVGVASADQEIMNKAGELTEHERRVVASSPYLGAKVMLMARPLDLGALRCILAATEAKQPYFRIATDAATGKARWHLQSLGLFGRIIRICSIYDTLTSSRPNHQALSSSAALEKMSTETQHEFDPHLLSLFVKVLAGVQTEEAQSTYTID